MTFVSELFSLMLFAARLEREAACREKERKKTSIIKFTPYISQT